jgi:hypothetical protein
MLNIILLLLIFMFIFAVVGVTLFGSVYPEYFRDLGVGAEPPFFHAAPRP